MVVPGDNHQLRCAFSLLASMIQQILRDRSASKGPFLLPTFLQTTKYGVSSIDPELQECYISVLRAVRKNNANFLEVASAQDLKQSITSDTIESDKTYSILFPQLNETISTFLSLVSKITTFLKYYPSAVGIQFDYEGQQYRHCLNAGKKPHIVVSRNAFMIGELFSVLSS